MTRLPHSWSACDAVPPKDLDQLVSPREIQVAVQKHDTLLEVQQELRVVSRVNLRIAVNRLNLRNELTIVDANDTDGIRELLGDGGQEVPDDA